MLMDGFLLLLFAPWPQGTGWFKVWMLLATDSRALDLGCPVCFYLFPLEQLLPQEETCRACLITLWHHADWRWIFFPLLRGKQRENQAVRVPGKWSGLSVGTHNYSWKDWICTSYFAWDEGKDNDNSISCDQWLGTEEKDILLASVSHQAVPSPYNVLYWDTGARCPKPFQKERHRWHLYCGST